MTTFEFDRYINGRLMAEGVTVEKAKTFEQASEIAARIASRGPNGETPVLVHRAALSASAEPGVGGKPDADLVERCREVLAWTRTGELPGSALRELAGEIREENGLFEESAALSRAETVTTREAMEYVVALSALHKESGETLPPVDQTAGTSMLRVIDMRRSLEAALDDFELIAERIQAGQIERAKGTAMQGAKEARAALAATEADHG